MKGFGAFLIITFILCRTDTCLAQSYHDKLDSAINYDIKRLKEKGIDTVCVYRKYCVGCIMMLPPGTDTSCRRQPYENNTYFFWKKNGITWFTEKTACFNYDTISVNLHSLWFFYNSVKTRINSKEIRPAEVFIIDKGKRTTNYVMIDHDTHEDIFLMIDGVRKDLSLTEFEFEKVLEGSGRETNINYTYNWNTRLKKLQVLLDESVQTNVRKLKKIK
jgi:hypothetical protein